MKRCPLFIGAMALLLALAALQAILPDRARSDLENRPLATLAGPSWAAVRTGTWMRDAETYVDDQFPGRDFWMNVQAIEDAALLKNERGGVLIGRDGWLFERCAGLDLRTATANMEAMASLAAAVEVPVSALVVPLSSAVAADMLPAGYVPDDPRAIQDALYDVAGAALTIDWLSAAQGTAEPLFYHTDHHWTAAGVDIACRALEAAWGFTPVEAGNYVQVGGFFGTYYARAPSPLIAPDALRFYWPDGVTLAIDGEVKPGLYDLAQISTRDKYAALLWGNHGRVTLHGPGEGVLLVIRDSYANPLLPLLAGHFERVEAIDPRYFAGSIPQTIEETEATSVLCVYGLTTILTDRNLLLHSAAWDG